MHTSRRLLLEKLLGCSYECAVDLKNSMGAANLSLGSMILRNLIKSWTLPLIDVCHIVLLASNHISEPSDYHSLPTSSTATKQATSVHPQPAMLSHVNHRDSSRPGCSGLFQDPPGRPLRRINHQRQRIPGVCRQAPPQAPPVLSESVFSRDPYSDLCESNLLVNKRFDLSNRSWSQEEFCFQVPKQYVDIPWVILSS